MTDTIPEAAVEAAAYQLYLAVSPDRTKELWDKIARPWKRHYRDSARAALYAAYPAIRAQVLEQAEPPEIRYATLDSGETALDEVVARDACVHLEQMADNGWWLGIQSGGQFWHINLTTKRAKITGWAEDATFYRTDTTEENR